MNELPEIPGFMKFRLKDVNPVSGNTKVRLISSPNDSMRRVHAAIIRFIRRQKIAMPSSTACRRGDSALRNVLHHRKAGMDRFNRYFFLADISSAYQAVDLDKMVEAVVDSCPELRETREKIRAFLGAHCFDAFQGGIVTGGPASPDLFNLYCEVHIDRGLRMLSRRYGLRYTRYLDDLTFSSTAPIGRKKRAAIRRMIEAAGFRISDPKARVYDLRKGPAVINGVGVRMNGNVFLPRRTLRHIHGLIHTAIAKGTIPPAKIHGKMGLLKLLTTPESANKTEQRVFNLYDRFKKMQHRLART